MDEIESSESPQSVAPTVEAAPASVEDRIVEVLRTVYDPEIPVNIHELGLIYAVEVSETGFASIKMTLTAPGCPVAGTLPVEVETKVRSVAGVTDAEVVLVWEPTWNPSMMTDAAKLQLGFM